MTNRSPDVAPTLETVRQRFVDAESQLAQAASALQSLQAGIEQMQATRAAFHEAIAAVDRLHVPLGATTDLLRDATEQLAEGVAVLRATDAGSITRRLDGLESTLDAGQKVAAERTDFTVRRLDARADELREQVRRQEGALLERFAAEDARLRDLAAALDGVARSLSEQVRATAAEHAQIGAQRLVEVGGALREHVFGGHAAMDARLSVIEGQIQALSIDLAQRIAAVQRSAEQRHADAIAALERQARSLADSTAALRAEQAAHLSEMRDGAAAARREARMWMIGLLVTTIGLGAVLVTLR